MDNEEDSDEVILKKWRYRVEHWESVVKQQFQLSYFGTIPFDTSSDMPIHEREFLFGLLREQKDSEVKARDDAIRTAKANSAANRKPKRTRRGRR